MERTAFVAILNRTNFFLKCITALYCLLLTSCGFLWTTSKATLSSTPPGSTTPTLVQGAVPVAAVYSNAPNWMDYVINSGGNGQIWNRCAAACPGSLPYVGTACVGTELGYFGCVHGGELRYFAVTGQSSCTGLVATDALGAFDWACDSSTGTVLFISKHLKDGVGLRDLITTAPSLGFLANQVTVRKSGVAVFQTPSSVWWTNTFATLVGGNATASTLAANTIYATAVDLTTNGYLVTKSDKVAIVTLGTSTITYNNDQSAWCKSDGTYSGVGAGYESTLICLGGTVGVPSRFLWIEARLNGNGVLGTNSGNVLLFADYVYMSRVHRTEVWGGVPFGANDQSVVRLPFTHSKSNLLTNVWAHDSQLFLISVVGSTYTTVMNSVASNSPGSGGFQLKAANSVLYRDIASNNAESGFNIQPAAQQSLVGVTAISNGAQSITMAGVGANSTSFIALGSYNNQGGGTNNPIDVENNSNTFNNFATIGTVGNNGPDFSGSTNNIRDLLSSYNDYTLSMGGNNNIVTGTLWTGQLAIGGANSCQNSGGAGNSLPGGNTDCTPAVGYTVVTGVDPKNSFVGLPTTDSSNTTAGFTSPLAYASITDFVHFANLYRGWGLDSSSTIFAIGNTGQCAAGTCQLYDYTLAASDVVMRNKFGVWANNGTCPALTNSVTASNVVTDAAGRKYLAYAVEVMDPWLNPGGNFDGLCESNEVCVFTPNIGSYQGSGDISTTTPCTMAGANGVVNVTIYAYPTN